MNKLPPYIATLWFAIRLLGGTEEDLLPHNRQTIHRAIKGEPVSDKMGASLRKKMDHVLFERLRRERNAPPGIARNVLDEIIVNCLRHYEYLSKHLQVPQGATDHALWILIREVWVPTIRLIFLKHAPGGLGDEFRCLNDWYIPQEIDGDLKSPVSVLFDRWLRTAGFRTAYGVTKTSLKNLTEKQENAWTAEKKKFERWLAGTSSPTLSDLYQVVAGHRDDVAWLDSAKSWRSRFFLAHVLTKALDQAESVLERKFKNPDRELALTCAANVGPIYDDEERILSDPATFYAVRLWLKKIKRDGKLDQILSAVPMEISQQFGPESSDEEIEQCRRDLNSQMNLGNHIAAHLVNVSGADMVVSNVTEHIDRFSKVELCLRWFAVEELNRMIAEETKNAGERVAPRRNKPKPRGRNQSS